MHHNSAKIIRVTSLASRWFAVAAVLVSALGIVVQAATNLSVWAYPSASGRIICQPDALGNRLLDYSGVGYKGGTVPIPNVATKTNLTPVAGDNGARIQSAINYVASLTLDTNGFRGAVQLAPGLYPISNTIVISASGIVLRGAGDGGNTNYNTVLYATYVGAGQPSLILISNSPSYTTVTTHNITNMYVPVGSRSFGVDSTNGFAPGTPVFVRRPSTSLWITNIGMNLVSPAWSAGSFDIYADRTITRVEGNVVTLDEPITCALEQQYGGATIYSYNWSNRITNVGVEYLRGISYFNPLVVTNIGNSTNYYADENHTWTFVAFDGAIANGWARNLNASNFAYSCVQITGISASKPGARNITVRDCTSLDPVSIIDGGRRYAFVLNDSQFCLVQNCTTSNDRHQFVTQSLTVGPHVFVDGWSDNAYADAGPHFRWATGAMWDNVAANGDNLAIRNRGNLGTSHGWAGANEVVWNSKADGLNVENPPTARNWLIGSLGALVNNTAAIPYPATAGTYDSLGSNVFPNSLYYAQLQSRLAAPNTRTREYWIGDIDKFITASSTGEGVSVDSTWRSTVQSAAGTAMVNGFDIVTNAQWIPFTFNFSLSVTDRIVGATLSVALRATNAGATNGILYLDAIANSNPFWTLGWQPIGIGTNTTVRVLDLGSQLDLLSDGKLNLAVSGDLGMDWAMLELQVAPVVTTYTNIFYPVADAYVRGGVNVASNFGRATTLVVKTDSSADNQRRAFVRWDLSGFNGDLFHARVRLTPVSVGTNGIENGITLAASNQWNETTLNWNNRPIGGKRFATWIPAASVPVEFVVTPQAQAALGGDGALSLELFSLSNVGGPGTVSYASREDSDPARQPQLILVATTPPVDTAPPNITNLVLSVGGNFTLSGTGPASRAYRILAATNVTLPLSSWTAISTGIFMGGMFTSTDIQASNHPQRFYQVVTP